MTAGEVAVAHAALARLLGPEARRAQLVSLSGGMHRRSWLVMVADGRRFVLRLPVARPSALLDIETEARAMEAAARVGVAPAVVAVDVDNGVLLTAYRPGTVWRPVDACEPRNIVRLAALLRALHAVPIDLPVFAAEHIADRYLAAFAARPAHDPLVRQWADELLALARRYDTRYAPTAFCHNDLVAANVLDDGALALVDFEYAVRGAPLLDLANLAAMNRFGAAEQCAALEAYNRAAPSALERQELAALVRMVRLFAWFWALAGETGAEDPSAYAQYLTELGADLPRE